MVLWSELHIKTLLPSVVIMLFAAILLARFLGKKSWKIRMIPFQVLTVVLLLLEVGKQVVSLKNGYDLYHLPFHFCSLFLYCMPVMAFYRGKHQQKVVAINAAVHMATTLLMLIYPVLIYSEGNIRQFWQDYFSFHTVVFHNIVVFSMMLIFALRLYSPAQTGEHKTLLVFTVVFCLISAVMAQLLQTNFNNFYTCNIPPLETVRLALQETLGYGLTQVLYVLVVTVLDILFVQLSLVLVRFGAKIMEKCGNRGVKA